LAATKLSSIAEKWDIPKFKEELEWNIIHKFDMILRPSMLGPIHVPIPMGGRWKCQPLMDSERLRIYHLSEPFVERNPIDQVSQVNISKDKWKRRDNVPVVRFSTTTQTPQFHDT